MATRKPVVIDGEFQMVSSEARLSDVLGREVDSISTHDGRVIGRDQFRNEMVPANFERQLGEVVKGE